MLTHQTDPFPLRERWDAFVENVEAFGPLPPTGVTKATYLDIAEGLVRMAMPWQNREGAIIDPFTGSEEYSATSRFVGALGNLIRAGRCRDCAPACLRAYEYCLARLDDPSYKPEFALKEMLFAHRALAGVVPPDTLRRWRDRWAGHDPQRHCNTVKRGMNHNVVVFVALAEYLKRLCGLPSRFTLIERILASQRKRFDSYGLYVDYDQAMTYELVARQQLDYLLFCGYTGEHMDWLRQACDRGAITSLFYQSSAGVMPFGGRTNAYHFVEIHFAAVAEMHAARAWNAGWPKQAGIFKRAARRAVGAIVSFLRLQPPRQMKQGFDPRQRHGIDSGGEYSVYSLLLASLCALTSELCDDRIPELATPAEVASYAFALPSFHQVFAASHGYSLQIDTRADLNKNATGLGRLHQRDATPLLALSDGITTQASYSLCCSAAPTAVAIGPTWEDEAGQPVRLASLSPSVASCDLEHVEIQPGGIRFRLKYQGDLHGMCELVEVYSLSADGLSYRWEAGPLHAGAGITVPLLLTDGQVDAEITQTRFGASVLYRGHRMSVDCGGRPFAIDPRPHVNRNGCYAVLVVQGAGPIRITIAPAERPGDQKESPCSEAPAATKAKADRPNHENN
ncbi:MAG TPA: hypothetical protein VF184_04475 [Phycisphaeraceae bacterium]